MKNVVFWHMTLCGSYKNRRSVGTHRLHHQGEKKNELGKALAVNSNISVSPQCT
jgi:hypothetical protein